jgi:hypothetical protein
MSSYNRLLLHIPVNRTPTFEDALLDRNGGFGKGLWHDIVNDNITPWVIANDLHFLKQTSWGWKLYEYMLDGEFSTGVYTFVAYNDSNNKVYVSTFMR